jgi:hypothetical protein
LLMLRPCHDKCSGYAFVYVQHGWCFILMSTWAFCSLLFMLTICFCCPCDVCAHRVSSQARLSVCVSVCCQCQCVSIVLPANPESMEEVISSLFVGTLSTFIFDTHPKFFFSSVWQQLCMYPVSYPKHWQEGPVVLFLAFIMYLTIILLKL